VTRYSLAKFNRGAFLLYGVWVTITGKRPGAGVPSALAGRRTSARRTTPSLILSATSFVVLTPYVAGRAFQPLAGAVGETAATAGAVRAGRAEPPASRLAVRAAAARRRGRTISLPGDLATDVVGGQRASAVSGHAAGGRRLAWST
jgi:hypothetical protein